MRQGIDEFLGDFSGIANLSQKQKPLSIHPFGDQRERAVTAAKVLAATALDLIAETIAWLLTLLIRRQDEQQLRAIARPTLLGNLGHHRPCDRDTCAVLWTLCSSKNGRVMVRRAGNQVHVLVTNDLACRAILQCRCWLTVHHGTRRRRSDISRDGFGYHSRHRT